MIKTFARDLTAIVIAAQLAAEIIAALPAHKKRDLDPSEVPPVQAWSSRKGAR